MAVNPGLPVAAAQGAGLPALAAHVAGEERQGPREGVGSREIGGVAPRDDPLLVMDGTVGAQAVGRVAGEDVPPAGAAVSEQALASREAVLDRAGRLQLAGDHQLASRL